MAEELHNSDFCWHTAKPAASLVFPQRNARPQIGADAVTELVLGYQSTSRFDFQRNGKVEDVEGDVLFWYHLIQSAKASLHDRWRTSSSQIMPFARRIKETGRKKDVYW